MSKHALESLPQRPVRHFAYPFGMRRHFSRPLRRYCASIGLGAAGGGCPP